VKERESTVDIFLAAMDTDLKRKEDDQCFGAGCSFIEKQKGGTGRILLYIQ
jgi:hypothetical protein